MALPTAPMTPPTAGDDERQFTLRPVVDTHMRLTDLSVVYTNDPVLMENSINTMEQLLDEDKYTVVDFNRESNGGLVGYDQKVVIAQLCVRHHFLICH